MTGQGPATGAQTSRPKKILVVNDSPDFLALMREILSTEGGYDVATLDQSEGVVREVTASPPSLLIIDIAFRRGRSGFDIADELAAAADTALIPVLFCTALSRTAIPDAIWETATARNRRVLFKPFDIDDLLGVVAELLAGPQPAATASQQPRV